MPNITANHAITDTNPRSQFTGVLSNFQFLDPQSIVIHTGEDGGLMCPSRSERRVHVVPQTFHQRHEAYQPNSD